MHSCNYVSNVNTLKFMFFYKSHFFVEKKCSCIHLWKKVKCNFFILKQYFCVAYFILVCGTKLHTISVFQIFTHLLLRNLNTISQIQILIILVEKVQ